MKLKSFHVRKFRNIVDSGPIEVDEAVTSLVGKNEAGKSGLLEALYYLNPAHEYALDVKAHYPRWLLVKDRKAGNIDEHAPIEATFKLEAAETQIVESHLGSGVLKDNVVTVRRRYDGALRWTINCDSSIALIHVKDQLPKSILPLVANADSSKALSSAIESLEPSDDEGGLTKGDITEALSVLKSAHFDCANIATSIARLISSKLPKFFRFTNYSTLPGRIDLEKLKNESWDEDEEDGYMTASALLSLADTTPEQLQDEEYEDRKAELEAVSIALTEDVLNYWSQNPDIKVEMDIDKENVTVQQGVKSVAKYLDIRLSDRTGYTNNFGQRSSGFQWFFSFLAAFSEFENGDCPIILLDEPALTLHAKAQADFLRFINERLAASPVLYTTHSPFMIEADKLHRARIVQDQGHPHGSICTQDILKSDRDSLFPLQAALGYDIAQNLFVGPNNLVVEGTSENIYLSILSASCKAAGKAGLHADWRILPSGGATNIPTFVALVGPHLDVTVLADSNTSGMRKIRELLASQILRQNRFLTVNLATGTTDADIEDLFSPSEYLSLFNKAFGSKLKVNELPAGDRIVKRIEGKVGKFVHGEVAEMLMRNPTAVSFSEATLDRFAKLFEAINQTMGS